MLNENILNIIQNMKFKKFISDIKEHSYSIDKVKEYAKKECKHKDKYCIGLKMVRVIDNQINHIKLLNCSNQKNEKMCKRIKDKVNTILERRKNKIKKFIENL